MPQFIVSEIVEGAKFQVARARLIRNGPPFLSIVLDERIRLIREELIDCGAIPPGATDHPVLDGSYVVEREGVRVRYYVTRAPQAGWISRLFSRRVVPEGALVVRLWLQALDWPNAERLSGS